MELIFIRHGKPKVEPGDNDPVLTDAARMQAERVGHWLRRENIARVVSSPMRRAIETAEPTSRILGLELEIRDGLAEVGRFGPGYRGIEMLRKDPVGWAKFMDDPISFLGGDPVTFKQGVLDAVAGLLDDRTERKGCRLCSRHTDQRRAQPHPGPEAGESLSAGLLLADARFRPVAERHEHPELQ